MVFRLVYHTQCVGFNGFGVFWEKISQFFRNFYVELCLFVVFDAVVPAAHSGYVFFGQGIGGKGGTLRKRYHRLDFPARKLMYLFQQKPGERLLVRGRTRRQAAAHQLRVDCSKDR